MSNFDLDPYEDEDEIGSPVIFQQTQDYRTERGLYKQLIAICQSVREHESPIISASTVSDANAILTKLSGMGHDYSQFIYPQNRLLTDQLYFTSDFRTKLLTALEAIASDYEFKEPSYLLGQYMQNQATTIHNHNDNRSNAEQHQIQEQHIEINIEKVKEVLEKGLSIEQLDEVKPEFKAYESVPDKWINIEKLIAKLLTFGSVVAPIVKIIMEKFLHS